jgi:hypothetical protein
METENNGWAEYSKHIILEMDRLGRCYEKLLEKVGKIENEIGLLKYKSGVWGMGASVLTTILLLLTAIFTGHIK